ncbi:MAG TPA: arsenate reductase ArsC [Humidesulfovibrio sp.]|uniref:arsenate reductase ArsC n=1 Tax=Humidesulfovibrio sp. TaxID=2910988 RepID=UPI002BED2CE1|nr:arsenate reductase ArsC [Humidesulfovibrio sp.]HWR03774.1 arsenate reductase ArsC [Humidesulfovibrio sp.]
MSSATVEKTRVLFVCGQNSARSQMAEALLDHLAGDRYEARSAGIEPAPINPLAVAVMAERGIDISQKRTKLVAEAVAELAAQGRQFDVVITVCSKAAGLCPFVPGVQVTERWSFDDPGTVDGMPEEQLSKVRAVRDDIEAAITAWLAGR